MGVYIKGMEMPVTCCHCPLMGYDPDREWFDSMARTGAHICVITHELINNTKREEHCPLVPVSPHGRLIDAGALEVHDGWMNEERERNVQQTHITFVYSNDIVNAPTIIPAEPEEEELNDSLPRSN